MGKWLKNVIVLASAFALMLGFRALVFSIHSVTGNGLTPLYKHGDCLLVNRCSYGLRIEGNGLLPYSRLLRQPVKRGDIVAFTLPRDTAAGVFIARCKAVPGDTIPTHKGVLIVPGLKNCAKADYYWPVDSRHLGLIPESSIIGEVITVLYNRKNLRLQ